MNDSTHPACLQREYCRRALVAHQTYFERARLFLRRARSESEIEAAHFFMTNASGEIARWMAALDAAEGTQRDAHA